MKINIGGGGNRDGCSNKCDKYCICLKEIGKSVEYVDQKSSLFKKKKLTCY